jgi:RHS repeat-associated protein
MAAGTEIHFYGAGGERLGIYQLNYNGTNLTYTTTSENLYFAGKLIGRGGSGHDYIGADRLGSIDAGNQYPWGEEKTTTYQNTEKFATYYRDGTGLDYADQRYYSSIIGKFLTPDPYKANNGGSGDPADPQSWNRYAYVQADPVNYYDPAGLMALQPSNTYSACSIDGNAQQTTEPSSTISLSVPLALSKIVVTPVLGTPTITPSDSVTTTTGGLTASATTNGMAGDPSGEAYTALLKCLLDCKAEASKMSKLCLVGGFLGGRYFSVLCAAAVAIELSGCEAGCYIIYDNKMKDLLPRPHPGPY